MPIFCSPKWIKNKLFSITFFLFFDPKTWIFDQNMTFFQKNPVFVVRLNSRRVLLTIRTLIVGITFIPAPPEQQSPQILIRILIARVARHINRQFEHLAALFRQSLFRQLWVVIWRHGTRANTDILESHTKNTYFQTNPILETLFSKPYFQTHISKTFLFSKSTLY